MPGMENRHWLTYYQRLSRPRDMSTIAVQYILATLGVLLKDIKNQYFIAMQFKNLYIHFSFFFSFFALPYAFKLILLSVIRFTHFTVFNLIQFVLISHLRANNGLLLVIASIGLLSLLIYLTLAISRPLYNWRRHIILIISLFSYVVLSLIRHL